MICNENTLTGFIHDLAFYRNRLGYPFGNVLTLLPDYIRNDRKHYFVSAMNRLGLGLNGVFSDLLLIS